VSRKPPDDGVTFEIVPRLDSHCVGCKRERDPEGEAILNDGATFIIQTEQPCECGERRVWVGFAVEARG
jgi:hypothetical protein